MKTNVLTWGSLLSSSMKAAVHLGPIHTDNLVVFKNTSFGEIQNLFGITQNLISDHSEENLNVRPIESKTPSWTRSILSHGQVIKWTKAKVLVDSDSVPCMGKLSDHSEANRRWEGQVADLPWPAFYEELPGIDGEPIELE